jgi:phosphoglycolate phosphatase-like HAD superfamily hydrolase
MDKPIIATTLSGLFIKSEPWKQAHVLWFKDASEKLCDALVNQWATRPDYFKGVDEVMQRLYPDISDEERTIKARETFFDSVCEYIKQHPGVKNNDVIDYFASAKEKCALALITTNTEESIKKILSATGLNSMFEMISVSEPDEKDDKAVVFDRFKANYGNPVLYVGGDRKDSFDYCKKNKIPCVFANLEEFDDLEGVESAHSLDELKKRIEKVIS